MGERWVLSQDLICKGIFGKGCGFGFSLEPGFFRVVFWMEVLVDSSFDGPFDVLDCGWSLFEDFAHSMVSGCQPLQSCCLMHFHKLCY